MPRPGPRPYEYVRRAWHSDRHQPMRGSLIQEIFRVANEVHRPATRKNKEWQEKLPFVVLKAEEIMYSKANSEAEYMDLKTLRDRANNAIDTIIRKDETMESGDLLLPCIEGPLSTYRSMVSQGKLRHDVYQEKVAFELEDLLGRLERYEKEMEDYHEKMSIWEKNRESERRKLLLEEAELKQQEGVWMEVRNIKSGFVDKWNSWRRRGNVEPGVGKMVSYLNRERRLDSMVGCRPVAPAAPKGIYLYGNVGSGKTMLMDMFYSASEGIVKHRRRFHFHEAMLEIHEHMHDIWKNQHTDRSVQSSTFSWMTSLPFDVKVKEWLIGEERYKQEVRTKHILPAVADIFLVDRKSNKTGASVLCFDEIQVSQITPDMTYHDFFPSIHV